MPPKPRGRLFGLLFVLFAAILVLVWLTVPPLRCIRDSAYYRKTNEPTDQPKTRAELKKLLIGKTEHEVRDLLGPPVRANSTAGLGGAAWGYPVSAEFVREFGPSFTVIFSRPEDGDPQVVELVLFAKSDRAVE